MLWLQNTVLPWRHSQTLCNCQTCGLFVSCRVNVHLCACQHRSLCLIACDPAWPFSLKVCVLCFSCAGLISVGSGTGRNWSKQWAYWKYICSHQQLCVGIQYCICVSAFSSDEYVNVFSCFFVRFFCTAFPTVLSIRVLTFSLCTSPRLFLLFLHHPLFHLPPLFLFFACATSDPSSYKSLQCICIFTLYEQNRAVKECWCQLFYCILM